MNSIVTQRFIRCHNKLKSEKKVKSSRQFALAVDYLPQSLSEILRGRRDVTIELIRKSVEAFKINPNYLFTGDGTMFLTEDSKENLKILTVITDTYDDEKIVHVPIPAQAGYAEESHKPAFVEALPTFNLPEYKYKVGTHRSFDVSGDCMEPTLFEGDKVVCSYLEPTLWASSMKNNYVYVIVTQGDLMVRRITNDIDDSRNLILHSDNDFYEDTRLKIDSIKEIWYVRAKISPFLPSPNNLRNLMRDEISELKRIIKEQSTLIEKFGDSLDKMIKND